MLRASIAERARTPAVRARAGARDRGCDRGLTVRAGNLVLIFTFNSVNDRAMASLLRVFVLLAILLAPGAADAYVHFTRDQIVASYFPEADRVESVWFQPSDAQRAELKKTLGYNLPKAKYEILVGRKGDATLGYAVVDEQIGQHEPITFAVLVDAAAKVRRVEVMVYREAYGDGVRAASFRDQFTGLDATSPMRVGKEIRIVSGATISSRSIATGTRRASALVEAWLSQAVAAG